MSMNNDHTKKSAQLELVKKWLYYSSIVFDPVDEELPYLSYPLLYEESEQGTYISLSPRGKIKNGKLSMKGFNTYLISNDFNKDIQEIKDKRKPLKFDIDLNKVETVTFSSVKLGAIYKMIQSAEYFDMETGMLWYYLLYPIITFFLFPLLALLLTLVMLKINFNLAPG